MTAELRILKRPRRPFPIPLSACRILNLSGSDFVHKPISFRLRRRKDGVNIMLSVTTGPRTAFSWTVGLDQQLSTFTDARRWVAAYAARYGQELHEEKEDRAPLPRGADAKALRSGACKEEWLSSDVPTLWAEAMVRCQHPGGFCGQDGFCHYGDCAMEMRAHNAHSDGGESGTQTLETPNVV